MIKNTNHQTAQMSIEEINELEKERKKLAEMFPENPSVEETLHKQTMEIENLKAALNALLERRVQ